MTETVSGGYCPILTGQIANVCALKKQKLISFTAVRVYLAVFEERKKRCKHNATQVQYRTSDIAKLLGNVVSEDCVVRALRQLERFDLLIWSESGVSVFSRLLPEAENLATEFGTSADRPVPIPRRLLRTLIRHTKPSEVMAALAHCVRCLFKKGKKITARGLVKASWVASKFGVSVRAVHATRRWLIALGYLRKQLVHQFVLNRWGGCFEINLKLGSQKRKARTYPQPKVDRGSFAPPYNDHLIIKNNNLSTNQSSVLVPSRKEVNSAKGESGFFVKKGSGPDIRDIRQDDLKRVSSLLELFNQAVKRRWFVESEANKRNFLAAAVRANQVDGDSVRIFVGIVKRGLWSHITHAQEERADRALKKYFRKQGQALVLSGGGKGDPKWASVVSKLELPEFPNGYLWAQAGGGSK